jgi:hypothetical protein
LVKLLFKKKSVVTLSHTHQKMPESSDGPKGHRAARRERDRFFEKTVIKMGLRTFCKESLLIELIEKAVQVSSQVTWEASLLVSFHVLRCLESGIDVEPLEQSFWDRCISAIANGDKGIGMNASEELKESFRLYAQLRPHEYVPVKREGYMNHIFLGLRQTMLTNFKTVFVETFHGRLCRWLRLKVCLSDRERLKHSNVIKSAIALLDRACTNEEGSVESLWPTFRRLEELTSEDIEWMQHLVDDVRQRMSGPLPVSFAPDDMPGYFPFLRDMLKDIEDHILWAKDNEEKSISGIKLFSILPQKKFRAPFIDISTTVLKSLVAVLRGRKRKKMEDYDVTQETANILLESGTESELWNEYFDVKSMVKAGRNQRRSFGHSVKTDGMSVSVVVETPRKIPLPLHPKSRKKQLKQEEAEVSVQIRQKVLKEIKKSEKFLEETRVVAIDPGVKAPFTAVVYNPAAIERLSQPHGHNVHFSSVSWKASKYYDECGITGRTREMRKWTNAAPPIRQFNETVATAKTSSTEAYAERCRQVLMALQTLLNFYVHKRRVRRARWFAYGRKQQATEKMIEEITATKDHAEQRKVLVAYGNAAMHNVKGTKPVVQKALRRKLARRCLLVDVDEFRTSKLCCSCLKEMMGKLVNGDRLHQVRHCENSACHRIYWNRDLNAAINILCKCLRFLWGQQDPPQFSRTY